MTTDVTSEIYTPLVTDPVATPAVDGLSLSHLACTRGGRVLCAPLTRLLPAGRMLRVRGANGAGKTTLLRTVCGLAAPASGQVLWRGQRVSARPVDDDAAVPLAPRQPWGAQLVFIGHDAALNEHLGAQENLHYACELAGQSPSAGELARALACAGVHGQHRRAVRQLSQGQRRRVCLARLELAREAALWVLDEPFNALDDDASAWLRRLIAAQLGRGGMVLLTSHHDASLHTIAHEELTL